MSSRHTRRKAAKAKALAKAEALAQAARAYERAQIVRANLSKPIERNFYRGCISGVYNPTATPIAGGKNAGFKRERLGRATDGLMSDRELANFSKRMNK